MRRCESSFILFAKHNKWLLLISLRILFLLHLAHSLSVIQKDNKIWSNFVRVNHCLCFNVIHTTMLIVKQRNGKESFYAASYKVAQLYILLHSASIVGDLIFNTTIYISWEHIFILFWDARRLCEGGRVGSHFFPVQRQHIFWHFEDYGFIVASCVYVCIKEEECAVAL